MRHLDAVEQIIASAVGLTSHVLDESIGPDLTLLGWRALSVLGRHPAGLRPSELADVMRISRPSASKLVHRLRARGLIELSRDAGDGRVRSLRLSWEGLRLRETVLERRRALVARCLEDPLPGDLDHGLRAIADRLEGWS